MRGYASVGIAVNFLIRKCIGEMPLWSGIFVSLCIYTAEIDSFCTKYVTGRFTKGILDSGENHKEIIIVKRLAANYQRTFG
jgi:hypothetical protein